MASTYRMAPTFPARMVRDPGMVPVLKAMAERAASAADDLAPERLGYLKSSVEGIAGPDPARGGVIIGRVLASDFKAPWWEIGTVRHGAVPFLRPGTERALPGIDWSGPAPA